MKYEIEGTPKPENELVISNWKKLIEDAEDGEVLIPAIGKQFRLHNFKMEHDWECYDNCYRLTNDDVQYEIVEYKVGRISMGKDLNVFEVEPRKVLLTVSITS